MSSWITSPTAAVLAEHCRWGGAGSWVAGIDAALDELAGHWGVELVAPLGGGCGGVAAIVARGGEELVMKATCPPEEGAAEAAGLDAFGSVGVSPRLLDCFDGPVGGLERVSAVLMERVSPGVSLGSVLEPCVLDDAQLGEVCGLLERMSGVAAGALESVGCSPVLGGLSSVVAPWVVLDAGRRERLDDVGVAPGAVQARTDELVVSLTCSAGEAGLEMVHGDLHPGNLLVAAGGRLLAVDCRAAVGDAAFDVGYLALSLCCAEPSWELLERLSAARGCDPARAWAWAAAVAPAWYASVLAWPWGRGAQLEGLGAFVRTR